MKNLTPFFDGFHIQTLRKNARSPLQKAAEELKQLQRKSFFELNDIFGDLIPAELLKSNESGSFSRHRIYSKKNVFWAFFSQIISADGGCQEVVKKVQAYCRERALKVPSSSTSSYCTARAKLELNLLEKIRKETTEGAKQNLEKYAFHDRRVVVVDGTGFSMPDTPENQQEWPQSSNQKEGCGFPSGRLLGCFCLDSGALLSSRLGNKKTHELPLLRQQHSTFRKEDIFLGDKAFCSYYDLSKFQEMGVDSVVPLARRKPISGAAAVTKLGDDDLLITWKRPYHQKKSSISKEEWEQLPAELTLRQIKVTVAVEGFRVSHFYLITTLTDPVRYPAEDLAALYYRRWDVELFFRDLKTTLNMDLLTCKNPEMIRKEIEMFLIAYNCIRSLMLQAAQATDQPVRLISFKGCLQAVRNWNPSSFPAPPSGAELRRQLDDLYRSIAHTPILQRPNRSEPRAIKRRPKPFQYLTAPRAQMKELPHRGKNPGKRA
jgi:hypothetical protein